MALRFFLALQFVVFVAVGCVAVSDLDLDLAPTPIPPDRYDCGEILGTAFRSEDERHWFAENCSAWTPNTLGEIPRQGASGP